MSTTGIVIISLVVMAPLLWFIGGFIFKIMWGFAPIITGLGGAGYLLWLHGLSWILALPVGIMMGILFTWLWQRSRIFLSVDRWVETHVFFDK